MVENFLVEAYLACRITQIVRLAKFGLVRLYCIFSSMNLQVYTITVYSLLYFTNKLSV